MKDLLLDTHIWIWFAEGIKSLKPKLRQQIDWSLKNATVYVAGISCWEVAMLEAKGRIKLTMTALEWMQQSFERTAMR